MTKIDIGLKKIKTIFHISDVHIRTIKRHKEYKQVFSRVYEEIEKRKDDSLIYLGGDIVHAKLEMSPELIQMTSDFFRNLADLAPTICITGNHDCNLNNRHRLDALSPIIDNLNHPNFHYLMDSGVYEMGDCQFVVMSIFEGPEDYILSKDVKGNNKIALFHGTIDNATTDFGYHLKDPKHTVNLFKGYDLALLGDLHKTQWMDKEHRIAYPGSLVQQNHGEGLDKGFLVWDVPTRKSEFIRVENDYGYYTLDIDKGKVPEVDNMPKRARLRVRFSNTNDSQIKKSISKIKKLYKVQEITTNRTDTLSSKKEWDRENAINVTDIRNVDFQNKLLDDYLKRQFFLEDDSLARIHKINEGLNTRLIEEEISRNVNWKLKKFNFDNMFSYGEGNEFDFGRLNGIVGLFGPNHIGKSSVLDALSFCLFDLTSRTSFARDVMNNKKDRFWCKLNIEINEQDYFIERTAKKFKNGSVKVDVEFWMVDETGEKVSLNGDQRRTTNNNIKRIIGTFDDFILTALSLQSNSTVFIDKTQKERKELLAQFMDINVFDQLYLLAQEEIHDVSSLLRNFRKQDYGSDLAKVEKELEENVEKYDELKKIKDALIEQQQKSQDRILLLSKKLKPVDKTIVDIDKLTESDTLLNQKIDEIESSLDDLLDEYEATTHILNRMKEALESFDGNDVDKKYDRLLELEKLYDTYQLKIDNLKREVQYKLDKVQKLHEHEYDPDCEFCVKNPFVVDAQKTKEELTGDKKLATDLVSEKENIENEIKNLSEIRDIKDELDNVKDKVERTSDKQSRLNTEKINLQTQKSHYQLQLDTIEDKVIHYYENEDTIKENKNLDGKITEEKDTLSVTNNKLQSTEESFNIVFGKTKVYENKRDGINKTIDTVKELEDKYESYDYYLDAVNRDGVPYELTMKMIPMIEGEVNNILSQIVDFSILFELDGKNINTKIVYDDKNYWSLELSSGMEKFIASIAIRVALINISNLPRPDFLVIDEGFGVLDQDNLNSLSMLFDYLKTQFRFILIISHIEVLRDVVDNLVEIKKEGQYSHVQH